MFKLLLFLTLTFMDRILYDTYIESSPLAFSLSLTYIAVSTQHWHSLWVCVIFVTVASDFIQIILLNFFHECVLFFLLTLLAHNSALQYS